MNRVRPIATILLGFLISQGLFAQTERYFGEDEINLQFGFSIKASFEIGFGRGEPGRDSYPEKNAFSIGGSAGIGSNFLTSNVYQTVNAEVLFYRGGLGSRRPGDKKVPATTCDFVLAFTLTGGNRNTFQTVDQKELQSRARPLYFFSNFSNPALENPLTILCHLERTG